MALVHDIAESIAGDITPHDKVSKSEKYKLEFDSIQKIKSLFDKDSSFSEEMESLWLEYEECVSPEAKLVKNLDLFEMVCQAFEYEKKHGIDLSQFFTSTRHKFSHPVVISWVNEIYTQRNIKL
ncbi:HD domain-containing protein 2-like protein [Smittium culicis]|uniref:HD domain-containing protein 2-like protein n=1 Tax=Smittium culicis TaxID=133412 RepID=A0A1R1Y9U8_9FUNG|nr:HD domain-containing protein 2-like protein [Smittium culicis]OMJ29344.1 HD domain-containing protein 2-like protein [Smittium culicis]